jgi:hypothetical protein
MKMRRGIVFPINPAEVISQALTCGLDLRAIPALCFKTMNKLLPAAVIVALGSIVFAITQFRASSALRAELAGIRLELDAERAQVKKLLAAVQGANDALALLKEDNDRLKKERDDAKEKSRSLLAGRGPEDKGAPGDGGPKDKQPDLRGLFQGFAKQLDDPDTRKLMKQGQERMVAAAYESLFKKLGLSEQDSKLVAELLGDRNFAALDKGRKILEAGRNDDASVAEVRKDIDATKAEYDAKLKSVLGDEKFAELTAFEQTVGDQRALDSFERAFKSKDQPLAPAQKTALADIMREERMRSPVNEIPDLGGGPGMAVLMSDAELKARGQQEADYQQRVLSRASEAGLNPDQTLILQDSFKQRNERRDFGARMGRAFIRPQ